MKSSDFDIEKDSVMIKVAPPNLADIRQLAMYKQFLGIPMTPEEEVKWQNACFDDTITGLEEILQIELSNSQRKKAKALLKQLKAVQETYRGVKIHLSNLRKNEDNIKEDPSPLQDDMHS